MKIEKFDGGDERRVMTAMIVDDQVLSKVATRWPTAGLFPSEWSNKIGGVCVEYYRKYGKAPGKAMASLYEQRIESMVDDDTKEIIAKYLRQLSDNYESKKKQVNSAYLIDVAHAYFNRTALLKLSDSIKSDIEANDLDRSMKRLNSFCHVDLGSESAIDILDPEYVDDVYAAKGEQLIQWEGALGNFVNDIMCRDEFIAFMAPEKTGKCVSADMLVTLADGSLMTIQDIVEEKSRFRALAMDEQAQRLVPMQIAEFWDNGKKECFSMITKSGRWVETTGNHEYLTPDGWRYLEQVRVGDFVAVPRRIPVFGTQSIPDAELRFLAYMLAEGGCTGTQPTFTNTDVELIEDFEGACQTMGIGFTRKGITHSLTQANPILRKWGVYGCSAKTKTIPSLVFQCPKEQLAKFLRIFFSCDGGIHPCGGGRTIQLGLANKRMLRQISHLLYRFGIVHKFQRKDASLNGKKFKAWRISIDCREYVNLFLDEINLMTYKKSDPIKGPSKSFLDRIPWQVAQRLYSELQDAYPDEAGQRRGHALREAMGGSKKASSIREQIAKKRPIMRQSFAAVFDHPICQKYLNGDLMWEEVVTIKSIGKKQTYDLSIPTHHNFVANDCIVHNTWWLIEMAWRALTQGRRVAFFEVGDMSQRQLLNRFYTRITKYPSDPGVIKIPTYLNHEPDTPNAYTEFQEKEFDEGLSPERAKSIMRKAQKKYGKDKLKLSVHANSSINVAGMESVLQTWERENQWTPDVVLVDYADILAPPVGVIESRDQINATWKQLRAMSQRRHCLLATATQTDADSYKVGILSRSNFSEDKRKFAHVTGMLGLNVSEEDKDNQITRLNWVLRREKKFSDSKICHVAGCLDIGAPAILSTF